MFAAVTELIRFTVSGSPVELSAHMPLVVVLVPQVMALRPRFAATVKVLILGRRWFLPLLIYYNSLQLSLH